MTICVVKKKVGGWRNGELRLSWCGERKDSRIPGLESLNVDT